MTITAPRFTLGQTVATPGAIEALAESNQAPSDFLRRHVSGDWGDLGIEDQQRNQDAIRNGERLFSAYRTSMGTKIWIITEADRSVKTLLLSDEY